MKMLMWDKPTRYHGDNNTNTARKYVYSLLKLSVRMPSSSAGARLHPFKDSRVFCVIRKTLRRKKGEHAPSPLAQRRRCLQLPSLRGHVGFCPRPKTVYQHWELLHSMASEW